MRWDHAGLSCFSNEVQNSRKYPAYPTMDPKTMLTDLLDVHAELQRQHDHYGTK